MTDRGQVAVTVLEAGIGAVLILSVAVLIAFAGGSPGDAAERSLDRFAKDVGTSLLHPGDTAPPLGMMLASERRFDRYASALRDRVRAVVPAGLFFRVETTYGSIGYPRPSDTVAGRETIRTTSGVVTIWVWSP